jgi:hypothetical protein
MGVQLLDFQWAAAIPPRSSESVSMGVQLQDYDFHTHPNVSSKESFGMGVQLLDYVFKTHPNCEVGESLGMGLQLIDFEYSGQATALVTPPATDPWPEDVVVLLHFDGADGSTTITDDTGKPWAIHGATAISATQTQFGSGALYQNGSACNIETPHHADLHLSADFTIECWVYITASAVQMVFCKGGGLNIAWASYEVVIDVDNKIYFCASSDNAGYNIGGELTSAGYIGYLHLNQWTHIAVTCSGNTYRGFVNGRCGYLQTVNLHPYESTGRGLCIGSNYENTWGSTPVNFIFGYVDEVRITKGVARYTQDFYPPTAPFDILGGEVTPLEWWDTDAPNVAKLDFLEPDGTITITDSTGRTWTSVGSAVVDNNTLLLSTQGSYIEATGLTNHGDYTIAFWICIESSSSYNGLFMHGATDSSAWREELDITNTRTRLQSGHSVLSGLQNTGSAVSISLNTWTHICVIRSGQYCYHYVNGTYIDGRSGINAYSMSSITSHLRFGTTMGYGQGQRRFAKIRMWDHALPNVDFDPGTPPSHGHIDPNIISQLRFEGADGSTTFIDDTGRIWGTSVGTISTVQKSTGNSSGHATVSSGQYLAQTFPISDEYRWDVPSEIIFDFYLGSITDNLTICYYESPVLAYGYPREHSIYVRVADRHLIFHWSYGLHWSQGADFDTGYIVPLNTWISVTVKLAIGGSNQYKVIVDDVTVMETSISTPLSWSGGALRLIVGGSGEAYIDNFVHRHL